MNLLDLAGELIQRAFSLVPKWSHCPECSVTLRLRRGKFDQRGPGFFLHWPWTTVVEFVPQTFQTFVHKEQVGDEIRKMIGKYRIIDPLRGARTVWEPEDVIKYEVGRALMRGTARGLKRRARDYGIELTEIAATSYPATSLNIAVEHAGMPE